MRIFFLCLVASFAVFPSSVNAIDIDALIDELVEGLPDENGNTPPPPPPASLAPEDFEKFEKEAAEYMHREELKLNETAGDWKGAEVKAMGELGDAFAKEAVDQHVEIKKDPTRADQIKEEKKKIRDSHPGPYVTFPEDEHEGSGAGEATTVVGETTSDESTTSESGGTTATGETGTPETQETDTPSTGTSEAGTPETQETDTPATGTSEAESSATTDTDTPSTGTSEAESSATTDTETPTPEPSATTSDTSEDATVTASETAASETASTANSEDDNEGDSPPSSTTGDGNESSSDDQQTTAPQGNPLDSDTGAHPGGGSQVAQLKSHETSSAQSKPKKTPNKNSARDLNVGVRRKRSAVVRKPTHKTKTQWKKRPRKIRDHDVVPKKISDKHKKAPHPTIRQKKKKVVAKQGRGLGKLIATASGDRRL